MPVTGPNDVFIYDELGDGENSVRDSTVGQLGDLCEEALFSLFSVTYLCPKCRILTYDSTFRQGYRRVTPINHVEGPHSSCPNPGTTVTREPHRAKITHFSRGIPRVPNRSHLFPDTETNIAMQLLCTSPAQPMSFGTVLLPR